MPRHDFSTSSDKTASVSNASQTKDSTSTTRDDNDYATSLPSPTFAIDTIPVNKHGERIDPFSPSPPAEEWDAYNQQVKQKKLCNKHYLNGVCITQNCGFDHADLSFDPTSAIKYFLRREKCRKGHLCRDQNCWFGHHCQKGGCNGKKPGVFDRHGHTLDLAVVRWEDPTGQSTSDGMAAEEPKVEAMSLAQSEWQPEPSLMDFDF